MSATGPGAAGDPRLFGSFLGWATRVRGERRIAVTAEQIFWLIHADLPRASPGSVATTRLLIRLAGHLPHHPRVIDIGCGAGQTSLVLAADTGGTVLAVDTHPAFLGRLRESALAAGLQDRIHTIVASMRALPMPDACADLVWAEGSAHLMGFDDALASWRRLLAPNGLLVLTEAEWTTPHPAPGARAFWSANYPGMRTIDGNARAALAAGWTVHATYQLPDSDWSAYHDSLADRLDQLRERGFAPKLLAQVGGQEIEIRRQHGADFGFTGYVLRPR